MAVNQDFQREVEDKTLNLMVSKLESWRTKKDFKVIHCKPA